jgi:hypothetical protein
MNFKSLSELIIVPGHGICRKNFTSPDLAYSDSSWIGIYPGEAQFLIEHCQRGVQLTSEKIDSLLVFSGGQTRKEAGRRSEAESYFEIASNHNWWNKPSVADYAVLEEYARDSFENLLFSLIVFKQHTLKWPDKVTVVGWIFKEKRYNLHCQALKWPSSKFVYRGVNNPIDKELQKALTGEQKKIDSIKKDVFLRGRRWISQREARNPFHRKHPYSHSNSELKALFDFLNQTSDLSTFPWT